MYYQKCHVFVCQLEVIEVILLYYLVLLRVTVRDTHTPNEMALRFEVVRPAKKNCWYMCFFNDASMLDRPVSGHDFVECLPGSKGKSRQKGSLILSDSQQVVADLIRITWFFTGIDLPETTAVNRCKNGDVDVAPCAAPDLQKLLRVHVWSDEAAVGGNSCACVTTSTYIDHAPHAATITDRRVLLSQVSKSAVSCPPGLHRF